jgi:hypothetical protein
LRVEREPSRDETLALGLAPGFQLFVRHAGGLFQC